jgi:hypothetical protein
MPALTRGNDPVQEIHLRALAAAIYAFDGNEPAKSSSVYIWTQTNLNFQDKSQLREHRGQSNRRHSALQRRAC